MFIELNINFSKTAPVPKPVPVPIPIPKPVPVPAPVPDPIPVPAPVPAPVPDPVPTPVIKSKKKVMAHFMLAYVDIEQSVNGYMQEILIAQEHGIDGFALNTGSWPEDIAQTPRNYQIQADLVFEAAKQLNTSFELCLCADMDGIKNIQQLRNMVLRYHNHPNQMKHNGKLFFSTFSGASNSLGYSSPQEMWKTGFIDYLYNSFGIELFFVPNFFYYPPNVFKDFPMLDGVFRWVSPSSSQSDNIEELQFKQASLIAGKTYMTYVTPTFYSHQQHKNIWLGNFNIVQRWLDIIHLIQPDFIEYVTWNDFSENSYITDFPNAVARFRNYDFNRKGFPHTAFMHLSKFFIEWYKTSKQPLIKENTVYYWYRTHSHNSKPLNDPISLPVHTTTDVIEDKIYLFVLLKETAVLSVSSGETKYYKRLSAGYHSISYPFDQGEQIVSLHDIKNNLLGISKGEKNISNYFDIYDLNFYSNFFVC